MTFRPFLERREVHLKPSDEVARPRHADGGGGQQDRRGAGSRAGTN